MCVCVCVCVCLCVCFAKKIFLFIRITWDVHTDLQRFFKQCDLWPYNMYTKDKHISISIMGSIITGLSTCVYHCAPAPLRVASCISRKSGACFLPSTKLFSFRFYFCVLCLDEKVWGLVVIKFFSFNNSWLLLELALTKSLLLYWVLCKCERKLLLQRKASELKFNLTGYVDLELWYGFFHSPNRSLFLSPHRCECLVVVFPWQSSKQTIKLWVHLCYWFVVP